ncbi:MAG: Uma2 family endonuclease [Chloroflexi bacterium]|nr:Uma2 family endonuclease [Chloroflexota bacterium]
MAVQQRTYNIDDLWHLVCRTDDDKYYELIEGEIIEMSPPGGEHSTIAGEFYHHFRLFDPQRKLGIPTVDAGYHPPEERNLLLSPDAAFTRIERAPNPFPKTWVPVMPDIAVEVQSPSNTLAELRRKAAIYLENGSQLVWIVIPDKQSAEVYRLDNTGNIQTESIGADGILSGERILPGFSLKLSALFS